MLWFLQQNCKLRKIGPHQVAAPFKASSRVLIKSVSHAVSNETSLALSRRLRAETQGEVLFDNGSRGRYATDASIYQIMPVGVFVPKNARDVGAAIGIARDLRVPILARGAGTSQCGQTTGAALIIDNSKYFSNVLEVKIGR